MTDTSIYEISTKHDIIEGAPNRTLESAILIMGTKSFRRLPITKLGKIRGIITVPDIIRAIAQKGLPEAFDEEISTWMSKTPKTIFPDASVIEAAKKMSAGNFGSLLVVDEGSEILKAIVTERDILHYYKDIDWDLALADIDRDHLTQSLVKISQDSSLEETIRQMNENHTHRIVTVDIADEINGILTANDITGLCSREREEINQNRNFLKSITANFISTNDVVSMDINSNITDAVKKMCSLKIGSLPITENEKVIGIFSERTLVHLIAEHR